MKVNCEAELVWVDLRAHVYLSPASMNMSSLSSTPLGPAGALRPGVEVLTMGTDWEACSIASDATLSDKIVTEWIKKKKDYLTDRRGELGIKWDTKIIFK